ncbi:hypothetical protein BAE44_0008400 [Dichanthelium oligosanthes]|uniref:protein-serine/threonine phosphatase n=1 Tax=Dichanthelium oligosanthes TaxID=888268 RepID=A0A1E5VZN0_9POAL|nr:hypothetical protein BAE44_0008400 [Dichanthelium oligosanthes]
MSNEIDVPAAATGPESLKWGESPALYLSFGTAALEDSRPAQAGDTVVVMPSFTVLSPPMGLDYFAVFDSRHPGAGVSRHLIALLDDAIARQVEAELARESPRFAGESPDDVVGWWETVVQEAFRVVHEDTSREGEDAAVVLGTSTLVALVLEKYIVIANCGASKAVLCRGGEHVELPPEHRANKEDENKSVENVGGNVPDSPSKPFDLNVPLQTTTDAFGNVADSTYNPFDLNVPLQTTTDAYGNVAESTSKPSDLNVPLQTTTGASGNVAESTSKPFDLNVSPQTSPEPGSSQAVVIPKLDVVAVERREQDEFLILGSDGLWGAVSPQSACAFVQRRLGKTSLITMPWEAPMEADATRASMDLIAKELAEKAVHAGSKDNVVSIAIVLFRVFLAQSDAME